MAQLSPLLQGLTGCSKIVSRTEVLFEGSPGEGATPKFKWLQAGFRSCRLLARGPTGFLATWASLTWLLEGQNRKQ